ncbi:MAG: hypothetical protein NZL98_05760 [Anaerolineales bacterium]|nr:hypothetical protein [Anaerolineales bacterium]
MNYDLYIESPKGNTATELRLLVTQSSEDALKKYVSLIHGTYDQKNRIPDAYNTLISDEWKRLRSLGLQPPASPPMDILPPGSWFLQFTFTLAKPWMSKDDDPFYVAESVNPVRKDKVFKVPVMSAAGWKGLLRWTVMHIRLAQKKDGLTPEQFARERFVQTLLFGDEQGEEAAQAKGFASYLDALRPEARAEYERLLRQYYQVKPDESLPHHTGRLMFYPTFFDRIDVEVINPHSRKTKAGTHPIYLECVPAGAKGVFSLLYVPFDLIGQEEAEIRRQAAEDVQRVAEGLQAMFLIYGFSAKRTSGYGVAEQKLENGFLQVGLEETPPPTSTAPTPAEPSLPRYLQAPGKLKDEYLNPDGTFRVRSQAELAKMTKSQRQEYEKAQKWWEREGKAMTQTAPAEPQPKPAAPAPRWFQREFESFDELLQKVEEARNALVPTGGDA